MQNYSLNNYQSIKTFSVICLWLFSFLILIYGLITIFSFIQIVFTEEIPIVEIGEGSLSVLILAMGIFDQLIIVLTLLTSIFFLIWKYRAFKNLAPLQATSGDFTPGWAVGWWFIPFLNFFKPYQAMCELWNLSDPDFDEKSFLSNQIGNPKIIGIWWAIFIISRIFGNFLRNIEGISTQTELNYWLLALMINMIITGVAAYFIATIIWKIKERQELRFQKLSALSQFSKPPSPPEFSQKPEDFLVK